MPGNKKKKPASVLGRGVAFPDALVQRFTRQIGNKLTLQVL